MQLDFNQLRDLIAALDQTDIAELSLKSGELELTIRRGASTSEAGGSSGVSSSDLAAILAQVSAANAVAQPIVSPMPLAAPLATPMVAAAPTPDPATPSSPPPADPKWVEIVSPMVGTFYRAPAPTEPPFVDKGDRVSRGQTVCIIEAMKLMNEVEAEVSGEVIEILVENGQPVEFNQPLMRVMPS